MLLQGAILMCAGMGTVFLFLGLLVVATTYSSKVIRRFEERGKQEGTEGGAS